MEIKAAEVAVQVSHFFLSNMGKKLPIFIAARLVRFYLPDLCLVKFSPV